MRAGEEEGEEKRREMANYYLSGRVRLSSPTEALREYVCCDGQRENGIAWECCWNMITEGTRLGREGGVARLVTSRQSFSLAGKK